TNNGTVKLTVGGTATDNIAVKGLGSAAYTASTAYATAAQGAKADSAVQPAALNNYVLKTEVTSGLAGLRNTSGDMPSGNNYGWGTNWSVMFNGDSIEGIAMCSTSSVTEQYWGPYCWCRMIRPVKGSNWVYLSEHSEESTCLEHCAYYCSYCLSAGAHGKCTRAKLLA
ncbi:MAG: hypothetical protein LBB08_01045, partial [Rickettsiales bacterium]|nr:hypothetical protein [Rickettsiales bacterium]